MKNTFLKRVLFGLVIASSALLGACSDDDTIDNTDLPGKEGFFVVNEGAFGNGDASLSYYDEEKDQMINDIFMSNTGKPLGDQAQSMNIFNGMGYIVVQGSKKIEVINLEDMTSVGTVTTDDGLESPRYIVAVTANKAYVSDWGDGFNGSVKVLDLQTLKVTKTIKTGSGANNLINVGGKVYVANSGGYGYDNTVSVIDVSTDEIIKTLEVGDNPSSLQVDEKNNIWVAGKGKTAYNADWSVDEANSTPGFIAKLNNDEVVLKLESAKVAVGFGNLVINKNYDALYYTHQGAVYRMSINDTELPGSPFIDKSFYGLAINPFNGNLVATEAPNFSSSGTVYIYNESGVLQDQLVAGIAPNGCAFK